MLELKRCNALGSGGRDRIKKIDKLLVVHKSLEGSIGSGVRQVFAWIVISAIFISVLQGGHDVFEIAHLCIGTGQIVVKHRI